MGLQDLIWKHAGSCGIYSYGIYFQAEVLAVPKLSSLQKQLLCSVGNPQTSSQNMGFQYPKSSIHSQKKGYFSKTPFQHSQHLVNVHTSALFLHLQVPQYIQIPSLYR